MTTTVKVQNIKCQGCAHTITTNLSGLNGVEAVSVTTDSQSVAIQYKNENVLAEAKKMLVSLGYPVNGDNAP